MALINLVNDFIKAWGEQDIKTCRQQITDVAQDEINTLKNNIFLTEEEKIYRIQRIKQIESELLAQQDKRAIFLEAAGFLNELSKLCDKSKR